jgi:hypothetical protein
MRRALLSAAIVAASLLCPTPALIGQTPIAAPAPASTARFAERVAALSEPGGYFDTDNLISNERTFLSVLPDLRAAGVRGGAYLGVGPDQNFSYMAAIRPSVAVLVDIRRDNMLLHLLFKALFAESDTRVTYLANLCGRTPPADAAPWRARSIDQIVTYVSQAPAQPASVAELRERITRRLRTFGVPLSAGDLQTIARFHGRFIEDGLDLRFQSTGRAPQSYYPTLRDLVLGTDAQGARASYLADEDAFQFLRAMQARDAVIPAVGDLSGAAAMTAIARFLRAERLSVSAFYTSNVEFYLDRSGTYARFVENVRRMPWAENGVIIRSRFTGGGSVSEIEAAALFLR